MFDSDKRKTKELGVLVNEIEEKYNTYKNEINKLGSNKEKINYIRRISNGLRKIINSEINDENYEEVLKKYLSIAYAICMCAIELSTGDKLYKCQLEGGILLNDGYISEMATGEGKTRTAILAAYLNSLTGRGVNVVTPNEYLAGRDFLETKNIYNMLGVSCGLAVEYKSPTKEEVISICASLLNISVDKVTNQMINSNIQKINEIHREGYLNAQREAYKCDIVYSSKDTLAFDYLKDVVCKNDSDIVQSKLPNFVIVDEVDAILFEDAQTPFILSGPMKTKTKFRNEEEKEAYKKSRQNLSVMPEAMNNAVMSIAKLAGRAHNIGTSCGLITLSNELSKIDINGISEFYSKMPSVINNPLASGSRVPRLVELDEEHDSVVLTDKGYIMIYNYFNRKTIDEYSRNHRDEIINFRVDGKLKYRPEIDYTISINGDLRFTEIGIIKALSGNDFSELYDHYNNWCITELSYNSLHLNNALTAVFNITSGKDYQLHNSGLKTIGGRDVKQVELIINGRTSEGRTYSNGLQQAIEYKEKELSKLNNSGYDVKISDYKDTLASIPTISFFKRFKKLGGMTGTSSKEHFKDLYGLSTYSVLRNKERQVIDRGDYFFVERSEKDKEIIREVFKSIKKGQPVLLSTTSVSESKRYMRLIKQVLDYHKLNNPINILNAEIKDREEEAYLISQAGLPGSITIATNMAGRGTDIKLGGVVETLSEAVNRIKEEVVQTRINKAINAGMVKDKTSYNNLIAFYRRQNEKNISELIKIAKIQVERQKVSREAKKKFVEDAGGLKVICAGHFASIREDNQVKGRCGRQGEKGETLFISCPQDLMDIGMDFRLIDYIVNRCHDGKLIDDYKNNKFYIRKEIEKTQKHNDNLISDRIYFNELKEGYISRCRNYLNDLRFKLRSENNYTDYIKYIISEVIKEFVSNCYLYRFTKEEIIYYFNMIFGINVNLDEELDKDMLIEYLEGLAIKRFESIRCEKEDSYNEAIYKLLIFSGLDSVWEDFEELVDDYKNQEFANSLTGYQGEEFKVSCSNGFVDCWKLNNAELIKNIFNSQADSKIMEVFPIYTYDKERMKKESDRRRWEAEESYIY